MKTMAYMVAALCSLLLIQPSVASRLISTPTINQQKILSNAKNLDSHALQTAIKGYKWAVRKGAVRKPDLLTVIDFDKPSSDKRLWLINLKTSRILLNAYTTQGKNSGYLYATHFSNRARSDETSLGVYETLYPYVGKDGYSLKLNGLSKGINDNAFRRAIIVHPALYARPSFVKTFHRAGRSWGCFALDPAISKKYIELTKNGSVIVAYAKHHTIFTGV